MRLWEKFGRIIYFIIDHVFKLIPFQRARTRSLILSDGKVLLVKNWLGRNEWTLPGGGKKRGESPENAVKREVHEELGIRLRNIKRLGLFENERKGFSFDYELFVGRVANEYFNARKYEITKAQWFPVTSLPKPISPIVSEAIDRFKEQ